MKINVSYETVGKMLEFCSQLKEGRLDQSGLNNLLDHPDYQIEFSRYQDRVSREEFIDFFTNFFALKYDELKKEDFKVHYQNYKYLFDNLDLYQKEYKNLSQYKEDDFARQAEVALNGLPAGYQLPDLNFIFTISIGMSFGWVFKNYSHYDVIQLIKNYDLEEFMSVLAHEIHHIGLNEIHESLNYDQLPLEQFFYLAFSGEGLAVKYCNNAEGVLSKPLRAGKTNLGLDNFTWNYLNNDFDHTFSQFKEQLNLIRTEKITKEQFLQDYLIKYWMKTHTEEQDQSEAPALKHFRLYTFGNDIWGVIHDVFGKEKVYHTLHNLDQFPQVYNQAVTTIGKSEYTI